MELRHRRALGLACVVGWLTTGLLLAASPAAGAAGWRWPLDPPVTVVAGFTAPTLAETLSLHVFRLPLAPDILAQAIELSQVRYATEKWTLRC